MMAHLPGVDKWFAKGSAGQIPSSNSQPLLQSCHELSSQATSDELKGVPGLVSA